MKRTWLILLLLVVGGLAAWRFFKDTPQEASGHHRQLATHGLAEYLATRYPGQRALVTSNPFAQRPGLAAGVYAQERAGVRGLQEGFGKSIVLEAVVFPELKPEAQQDPHAVEIDASSCTPLSYLVAEDAFDKLVQAHPGCELVVSLIGLPRDLERMEAWRKTSRVKFALLFPDLRIVGDAAAIRDAMRREKLVAFVLPKPGAPSEQTGLGRNLKAEFERRFLLVTPDNVEQMLEAYPRLFDTSAP